jgi:soluble lytic murein transglycosylase-like protein
MRLHLLIIVFLTFFTQGVSFAANENAYCFEDAAVRNGVDKVLLMAIANHESSFKPNAINRNSNGTEDIGVMQINTSHMKLLNAAGFNRKDLFDTCTNIHLGALILKDCIKKYGQTWAAVGAYNVGYGNGPKRDYLRRVYIQKVWTSYKKIKGEI